MPSLVQRSHPCDSSLGVNSRARSLILSFLNKRSLEAAAHIHEQWFVAASSADCWQTAVERYFAGFATTTMPQIASWYPISPSGELVYRFRNPAVFTRVLQAVVQYSDSIRLLLDDDEFFKNVGTLFGSLHNVVVFQLPVLLVLLHIPEFLHAKLDSVPRDGYLERRRFLLLIANVVRWHVAFPHRAHVRWLLEIFRWTATYFPLTLCGMDIIALSPAFVLLHQAATCPLLESEVVDVIQLACTLLQAMSRQNESNDSSSPSPEGSSQPRDVLLQVLAMILEHYRHMEGVRMEMQLLLSSLTNGTNSTTTTLVADIIRAKVRLDITRVLRHLVAAEKQLTQLSHEVSCREAVTAEE